MGIRLTTWNIAWLGQLLKGYTRTIPRRSRRVTSAAGRAIQQLQKEMIAEEIRRIDPDILCSQEGSSTGNVGRLVEFCEELLDGEVFYTLREAQILIERWRRHYNTARPHSAIGYRPPAPEVIIQMDRRPVIH